MSRAWITTLPDGRTEYVLHQSWLSDTDLCLERARRGLLGEPDPPSDASSVGTGVHAGAQAACDTYIEYGEWLDLDGCLTVAFDAWAAEQQLEGFTFKKRGIVAADRFLERAVTAWHERVMPELNPFAVEVQFGPYVLYEDDKRVVKLGGQIDLVETDLTIKDWKTGSPHSWQGKDWLKARGAIQPTTYLWALLKLCEEFGWGTPANPNLFEFVVMMDQGPPIFRVPVLRRTEDFDWLKRKVHSVVLQIERGTDDVWPMQDQDNVLCSAKWCPYFVGCKGAHVASSWPK